MEQKAKNNPEAHLEERLSTIYNELCEKAYNNNPDMDYDSMEFENVLNECQTVWANTLLEDKGFTIKDFLFNLDFGCLCTLFEYMAKGDFPVPMEILRALDSFGEQGVLYLYNHAFDMLNRKEEPGLYISIQAVKGLGRLHKSQYVGHMLTYVTGLPENEDMLIESVVEGIMEMGPVGIDEMVECINGTKNINNNLEYVLQALAQLGKNQKSTKIFDCLKSAFLRMKNKDLGALCIAEYGDIRGISVLNNFLDNNKRSLQREVFFEILHCIKELGGRTDFF